MSDHPPPPPPPPADGPPPPPEGTPDPTSGQPPGYGQPPQGYGQPPQGYGQAPPPGYGHPAAVGGATPSPSPLAIGSLVTSIIGLLCCSSVFVLSIAAIAMGVFARKEISQSGGLKTGDGLAIAGLVIGGLGILFGILTWGLRVSGVIGYGFSPF